jgi:hypothetical protein
MAAPDRQLGRPAAGPSSIRIDEIADRDHRPDKAAQIN